jgi:hypothetical protein
MRPDNATPACGCEVRRDVMARLFALATTGALFEGCSGGSGRAAPVNPGRAREALKTALESWKKGEKPDALKSASPSIVVQDFDWMAGRTLVQYEVTGEGKDDDANLRIPVTLTIRTAQGKEVRKDVSYVVGTSPSLTVFRDFQ